MWSRSAAGCRYAWTGGWPARSRSPARPASRTTRSPPARQAAGEQQPYGRRARTAVSKTGARFRVAPGTAPQPCGSYCVTSSGRLLERLAVHAPSRSAAGVEDVVAEFLLGQVVQAEERLVVQVTRRPVRRTEDVGALVAVLEAVRVIPAGLGVRVGDCL